MNRKQFIESVGATCRNWRWSWSFVNEIEKFVVFGAWDKFTEGGSTLIFSEKWATSGTGRKQQAYPESREYIRLIEEEGYRLYTFPQEHSDELQDAAGNGPAKVIGFTPQLEPMTLTRIGDSWHASAEAAEAAEATIPEEVVAAQLYTEGTSVIVNVNSYERSAEAREACIKHYGYRCKVCDFSFFERYGEMGRDYIHVHHVVPLSEIGESYEVDPVRDLIPVCPNCHAVIHRTRPALSVEEVKQQLAERSSR